MELQDKATASPSKRPTERILVCALLSVIALMCSYLESLIPFTLIIPVAGFKLGSANAVSAFAGYRMGLWEAAAVLLVRVCLGALLFGSLTTLLFSLFGAALSYLTLAVGIRCFRRYLSQIGVSVACAASHQIGQTLAAVCIYKTPAFFSYLPLQLLLSIPTGCAVGALLLLLCKRVPKWR